MRSYFVIKAKCSDSPKSPTLVISHQNVILPLHNRGLQILLASGDHINSNRWLSCDIYMSIKLLQLNRSLRSSSVPRHVPTLEKHPSNVSRWFISLKHYFKLVTITYIGAQGPPLCPLEVITPHRSLSTDMLLPLSGVKQGGFCKIDIWTYFIRDRSLSVPPASRATVSATSYEPCHYTDFDLKVIDYMSKLERQDVTRSYIAQTRVRWEKYFIDNCQSFNVL